MDSVTPLTWSLPLFVTFSLNHSPNDDIRCLGSRWKTHRTSYVQSWQGYFLSLRPLSRYLRVENNERDREGQRDMFRLLISLPLRRNAVLRLSEPVNSEIFHVTWVSTDDPIRCLVVITEIVDLYIFLWLK